MSSPIAVAAEATPKKTFASAIDWPGWSRSGKTEADAIEALLAYAPRYGVVARRAGEPFPADGAEIEVVESGEGGSSTTFGVPGRVTEADRRPTTTAEADRLARLVAAAWATFDEVAAAAPEELRKGPRGGGRDRTRMIEHVLGAEHAYAGQIGLRVAPPSAADPASVTAMREAILEVLRRPSDGSQLAGRKWTARYAAHRIAWHALDHAWEIEDRSDPG